MKTVLSVFVFISYCSITSAQLKTTPICPEMTVNILEGNVNNKVEPDFTAELVKKAFPCFTPDEAGTPAPACGDIVSYRDRGIYFYTGRGYIEIREKFKGKLSLPLMGAARISLFSLLGNPTIKDVHWDAFQTAYGIVILNYNKAGKVNLIQFSKKHTETLTLCE
jgi:hypothetical protein